MESHPVLEINDNRCRHRHKAPAFHVNKIQYNIFYRQRQGRATSIRSRSKRWPPPSEPTCSNKFPEVSSSKGLKIVGIACLNFLGP